MCEAEFLVAAPGLCRVWCDFGNQFLLANCEPDFGLWVFNC